MGDYKVVVVGTDGSESSLRAVDEAAKIAAKSDAKLIIASAYLSEDKEPAEEPDQPQGDGYKSEGNAPVYARLREASDRAKAAGVHDVDERPIEGAAVDVLVNLVEEVNADLLVVGNVGLNSVAGRLLGSVPSAVRSRAKTEVLIAETKD